MSRTFDPAIAAHVDRETSRTAWVGSEYPRREVPLHPDTRYVRSPACVEQWPECETFGYDPRCCRFPKSCSADQPLICPWPAPEAASLLNDQIPPPVP